MTRSIPKRPLAVVALLVLAGIALAWWQPWREDPAARDRLYGNVELREVQLAFRAAGRLATVGVEEGDRVVAGDALATLDAEPFEEALAVAEANVARARAELARVRAGARPQEIQQAEARVREARAAFDNAARNAERQERLLASRSTSQTAADAARAERDAAAARLASAEEALTLAREGARAEDIAAAEATLAAAIATRAQAETQVADATLRAPSPGTVLTRAREPGAFVGVGQAVFALALDERVDVRAYVEEERLGRVVPGTEVAIKSDSSPRVYRGRVGFVSPRAEFTPKSVETPALRTDLVYRLRVRVLDPDEALRQGMPVTLTLPATTAATSADERARDGALAPS